MSARMLMRIANVVSWSWTLLLLLLQVLKFGSTLGFLMASTPFGNPALLKPDPGLLYNLLPYETEEDEAKLVELMVLAGWRALPHPSLLAPDGNFYTGDLFEPVGDGYYLYRGRKNDWIMTGVGHICDTK